MKKAVLLNDTSNRYHHGCSRVTRRIKSLLHENEIDLLASNFAHTDWRRNRIFLGALAECDLIVINGEGTIHDGAVGGKKLLEIVDAPERLGRPVALVNALWQNNPAEWVEIASRCQIVSVRDSHSMAELKLHGLSNVRLSPDLSLSGSYNSAGSLREGFVVGDSVRYSSRKLLARVAQRQRAKYVPTKTLESNVWRFPAVSNFLWRVYNGVWDGAVPDFQMASGEDEYISLLLSAQGHITGRFHGVCLSILTGTPFLALGSKTSKIQTLLQDVGLSPERLISDTDIDGTRNLSVPPYTPLELAGIEAYLHLANTCAVNLFRDLRSLK